jgi:two-component system sensor histidine kinase/response regulator
MAAISDTHRRSDRDLRAEVTLAGRVVLVVDDDPTQRLLARDALEIAGFVVEEAADGPEGLAKAYVVKPDLVVLDVMMPGLDGFTVCDELRRHAATKEIPILLVTGLNDVVSMRRGFALGATDFITKPVAWETLAMRVKYIIRSHLLWRWTAAG